MKTGCWAILLLPIIAIDINNASPAHFENQKWNFDADRILPSNGKTTRGNIVGAIVSGVSRDIRLQCKMMNMDYEACLAAHAVPHRKVSWIDSWISVGFTVCCKKMLISPSHNSAKGLLHNFLTLLHLSIQNQSHKG